MLRECLKNRDMYFQSIADEDVRLLDDDGLERYNRFITRYNALNQLEKDVWYLSTQMMKKELADLYGVSRSYITQLCKKINDKLS